MWTNTWDYYVTRPVNLVYQPFVQCPLQASTGPSENSDFVFSSASCSAELSIDMRTLKVINNIFLD